VQVRVIDALGELFFGAQIDFSLRGASVGSVTDSAGEARITYPEEGAGLEVSVSASGATQSRLLAPGIDITPGGTRNLVDFKMPVIRSTNVPPRPVAKCPDGTAGQPCVDCYINGSTIRVCG